jgi:hypothetical protein
MILHESELHAALILVAQFATASTACLHPTHQNRHHHRTPCYLVHVVGWNDPQTRDKDEQDIRVITYWTYVFLFLWVSLALGTVSAGDGDNVH